MFLKVFIVAVALPFLTSAISTKRDDLGGLIHLGKRQSLSKPDGTFDLDKAIAHTVAVRNKHRQNLINLERNVGRKAFNKVEAFLLHCMLCLSSFCVSFQGAEIKPLAVLPQYHQKRQANPLTDQQSDTEWTGPISIGSPSQQFIIDFDSRFSHWIIHLSDLLFALFY
jgi:cathepsin D